MEQFEARFKQVDVFPLVKHFMDELDLINLFKKYVPAEKGHIADHAESLCILTANIVCENRPLYKVQEWLAKYADGLASEPEAANIFNDDRLGRALSALFHSERHSLMTEVSCNGICVHKLLTNEIHNDSTTITFKGIYDSPDPEAVKLKHGHNKDFRPDCKQIVFGLNITSDGHVPLSYKLFDGNTSDDVTHIPNWNALRTLLEKENFIYVADCKQCSQKNLNHISKNGGQFITIIPKDRTHVKQFKKHLEQNDVQWKKAFETENPRKKGKLNIYKTYELKPDKKGFRTIFVYSSSKQQDDKAKRQKRVEKALSELEVLSPKLNAYHLKTKKQIQTAVNNISKKVQGLIDVEIITERRQVKVPSVPGRRMTLNRDTYKNKWDFKYKIQWALNDQAIAEAEQTDGIFPLITNTELKPCSFYIF
ncbi:MAG: IS1634 family transposase [Thermodesulfobacteriota bacterium]|nr:IS1634 family transposase [Thermodesulfobacteriota bacterium]